MSTPADPELTAVAARALAAVGIGSDDGALAEVTEYVEQSSDPVMAARDFVLLLFGTSSMLVSRLGEEDFAGEVVPVRLQVFDADGTELSIDDAEPPVRTAVRTLLAQVHGDDESARQQVEIALASADIAEMNTVLLQALRWTARLANECRARALSVPQWIDQSLNE